MGEMILWENNIDNKNIIKIITINRLNKLNEISAASLLSWFSNPEINTTP